MARGHVRLALGRVVSVARRMHRRVLRALVISRVKRCRVAGRVLGNAVREDAVRVGCRAGR